jgi:hypothetical protein
LGVPVYVDQLAVMIETSKPEVSPLETMRAEWVKAGGSAEEFYAKAAALQERLQAARDAGWYAGYRNRFDPRPPQVASVAVTLDGQAVFLDAQGNQLDLF